MKAMDLYTLFERQIADYHTTDSVDAPQRNPYGADTFEALLWEKSWVDTVQWHLEDLVRPTDVDPVYALTIKRRIDSSNQHRTDLVERIDDHYMSLYGEVPSLAGATLNTETPAWAVDRLSILALKIYHFNIAVATTSTAPAAKPNSTRCSPNAPTSPPPSTSCSTTLPPAANA